MSLLQMTFECDHSNCPEAETISSEVEDAIKEDLEIELLENGWWIVRNWAYEKTYCSYDCMINDIEF